MKHNPQFKLGDIQVDEAVYPLIDEEDLDLRYYFSRHARTDWGDSPYSLKVKNDDILANKLAEPIKSVWDFDGESIVIETNADRSVTTISLQ